MHAVISVDHVVHIVSICHLFALILKFKGQIKLVFFFFYSYKGVACDVLRNTLEANKGNPALMLNYSNWILSFSFWFSKRNDFMTKYWHQLPSHTLHCQPAQAQIILLVALFYLTLYLQARILSLNAEYFLKVGGHFVISIKVVRLLAFLMKFIPAA
jgi:hypothetical protein